MSSAVVHQGVAYLAGVVPKEPSPDVRDQTRQVLATIDQVLQAVGSDKSRLLMANIFLNDIRDFAAMNEAWDAWVPEGAAPARATVEGRIARPGMRVEIIVTAAVDAP